MSAPARMYTVSLGGETVTVPQDQAFSVADILVAKYGGVPSIVEATAETAITAPKKEFSSWDATVVDADAQARIDAQHAKLAAAGISGMGLEGGQQFFANGTRMGEGGYATQAARKAEHDAAQSVQDAIHGLVSTVQAEKREDYSCSAAEFARSLHVDGKVTAFGQTLTEQAIRGIMSRLESPALGYLLGLRTRIAAEMNKAEGERDVDALRRDRNKVADILHHECTRNPGRSFKLRMRANPGDIFAVVSPEYAVADAPEVAPQLLASLPNGCKGTFSYDARSTQWELRAHVWTPTPTEEQAVGEAFQGYVSYTARDNGTSRFRGSGGVEFLRCLNASSYSADGSTTERVHRGRILYDIERMTKEATAAISVLVQVWAEQSAKVIPVPAMVDDKPVTLEQAIPGLFRNMLKSRELVGVLPGRTETHVEGLTRAYAGERRDLHRIVRADLGHAFTKYIQTESQAVRRDAEMSVSDWLMSNKPMRFDLG